MSVSSLPRVSHFSAFHFIIVHDYTYIVYALHSTNIMTMNYTGTQNQLIMFKHDKGGLQEFLAQSLFLSSFFYRDVELILWRRHQSIVTFHHLTWNGDQLELAYENTDHDGRLKMGENVAGAFPTAGGPKWAKLQPPAGMGSVGGKSVGIEPVEKDKKLNTSDSE